MIDLIQNTAGTKQQPIVRWTVVFVVAPLGVFLDREEAVKKCQEIDLNPLICVIPVAAAITNDDQMELVYR